MIRHSHLSVFIRVLSLITLHTYVVDFDIPYFSFLPKSFSTLLRFCSFVISTGQKKTSSFSFRLNVHHLGDSYLVTTKYQCKHYSPVIGEQGGEIPFPSVVVGHSAGAECCGQKWCCQSGDRRCMSLMTVTVKTMMENCLPK